VGGKTNHLFGVGGGYGVGGGKGIVWKQLVGGGGKQEASGRGKR